MLTGRGEMRALLPPAWRPAAGVPTVGDRVTLRHHDVRALVSKLLAGRTVLRRVSTHEEHRQQVRAANMDVVFVCFAAGRSTWCCSTPCSASPWTAGRSRCS